MFCALCTSGHQNKKYLQQQQNNKYSKLIINHLQSSAESSIWYSLTENITASWHRTADLRPAHMETDGLHQNYNVCSGCRNKHKTHRETHKSSKQAVVLLCCCCKVIHTAEYMHVCVCRGS